MTMIPKTLYHYCSNSTFHSIVDNDCVWASKLDLSNDSLEGKVALDLFKELAEPAAVFGDVDMNYISNIMKLNTDNVDTFGFCLSHEPDLLSQWRAYSSDGEGVCIGFDSEKLVKLAEPLFHLQEIVYDEPKQAKLLSPFLTELIEGVRRYVEQNPNFRTFKQPDHSPGNFLALHNNAVNKLFDLLFTFKHSAFHEEQEWRILTKPEELVFTAPDKRKFHILPDCLVPHYEIDFENEGSEVITKVILGPKNRSPKHVIEQFLHSKSLCDVEVILSEAPYR